MEGRVGAGHGTTMKSFKNIIQKALTRLPLALRNIKVLIGLAIAVILIVGVGLYRFLFPPLPRSVQVFDVIWLEQGWSQDQREKYYQTSQGTLILPYSC